MYRLSFLANTPSMPSIRCWPATEHVERLPMRCFLPRLRERSVKWSQSETGLSMNDGAHKRLASHIQKTISVQVTVRWTAKGPPQLCVGEWTGELLFVPAMPRGGNFLCPEQWTRPAQPSRALPAQPSREMSAWHSQKLSKRQSSGCRDPSPRRVRNEWNYDKFLEMTRERRRRSAGWEKVVFCRPLNTWALFEPFQIITVGYERPCTCL